MFISGTYVARPEKGGGGGAMRYISGYIGLLQKSYVQSWWHCRIAKDRGNYWLEKAWMVTNFRIVAIKSKNCMLYFI